MRQLLLLYCETHAVDGLGKNLELLLTHGFGQVVLNANLATALLHAFVAVGADRRKPQLGKRGVGLFELLEVLQNEGCRLNAVHDRHLDVGEHAAVPDVATRLFHVGQVHVHGHLSIIRLVALLSELPADDRLQRQQVKHLVVDEQHLRPRTALVRFAPVRPK